MKFLDFKWKVSSKNEKTYNAAVWIIIELGFEDDTCN